MPTLTFSFSFSVLYFGSNLDSRFIFAPDLRYRIKANVFVYAFHIDGNGNGNGNTPPSKFIFIMPFTITKFQ